MSDQKTVHGDHESAAAKAGTDVPLYEVVDKKTRKESSSDYTTLSVSTMNREMNIYAGVPSETPTLSKEGKKAIELKRIVCFLAISTCVLVVIVCFVAIFIEVAKLKTEKAFLQESPLLQQAVNAASNFSSIMFQLQQLNKTLGTDIQQLNSSIEMVQQDQETSTQELIQTLDNHIQQLNNSIGMVMLDQEISNNNIWELLAQFRQDIISIEDAIQHILAHSCAALIALPPSSPSGYYWVRTSNGSAVRVYCDMTRSCGGVTGGWMRVAELDMTNSSHQCPSGLTLRTESDSNIHACVAASTAGCVSIPIDIPYSYSRVCGRVIAYQVGNTNAFHGSHRTHAIDSNYVDGISLTHHNPRQHIWTFAAGLRENGDEHGDSICPCTRNPGAAPPPFVGDDYFCEAGVQEHLESNRSTLYSNDPLWDGDGCTDTNPCCSFNNPPWFYKQLPQPTTDNIEMRVCKDENVSNEDVAIEIVEIYVQ